MADKKLLTSAVGTLAALSFSLGAQAAGPGRALARCGSGLPPIEPTLND
jgi:hypothetical protein